jgi:hypothetical protein
MGRSLAFLSRRSVAGGHQCRLPAFAGMYRSTSAEALLGIIGPADNHPVLQCIPRFLRGLPECDFEERGASRYPVIRIVECRETTRVEFGLSTSLRSRSGAFFAVRHVLLRFSKSLAPVRPDRPGSDNACSNTTHCSTLQATAQSWMNRWRTRWTSGGTASPPRAYLAV